LQCFQRLAHQPLVQEREDEHDRSPTDGDRPKQRMEQHDDEQEKRQPRCIEKRDDARPREEGAQGMHVAQPVHAVHERRLQHARAERPVEHHACTDQQHGAQRIEDRHEQQRRYCGQREQDQGFRAAARQNPVEYLEHVERRGEQQQVDRQAEYGCVNEERSHRNRRFKRASP
jgi:hypothetical protein